MMKKEQKLCCGGSKGCKDRLLISKAILQEYKRKKKVYIMGCLSERFGHVATQLDNKIPRVNWG